MRYLQNIPAVRGDSEANFQIMKEVGILLKNTVKHVDPVIKKLLSRGVEENTKMLLFYQVEAGGKRLRPCLAMISCLACGGKARDMLYCAAGLEILHTYTLIVDDLIDHSAKRRGKLTTWRKFGKSLAECIGVDYGASLLEAAARSINPRVVATIYGRAIKEVVDGEILDILFEQGGREDEMYVQRYRVKSVVWRDYLHMIGKKTASLFSSACGLGGIGANASRREIAALKKYGWNLGIAFQIADDILDLYGKQQFGKPLGQDIRERKLGNILVLFALGELSLKERKTVKEIFRKDSIKESDVKRVIAYIKKTGAKERALSFAQSYVRKAKVSLNPLHAGRYRNALGEFAEFALKREK